MRLDSDADFCERENENSGPRESKGFVDQLSEYKLL